MKASKVVGIGLGATAVAAGLQKVYEVKRWDVPTPVWLGVTGLLTYVGWLGWNKVAGA